MRCELHKVNGVNRQSKPRDDQTIATDFEIDKMIPLIKNIRLYLRQPKDCPFARGNWMIDLYFKDGGIYSIKLPLEMTEKEINDYAKPLIEQFYEIKHFQ